MFILNRWIVFGAFLVMLGWIVLAVSDLAFAGLAVDTTLPVPVANQRYLLISAVYGAGEVIIGVGFFLALFGFARQVSAHA